MAAIVQQESAGNPLLLHDNTTKTTLRPKSFSEAAKLAQALIQSGHSVDIGLAQINNRNLPALGLKVEDVLDPCTNLQAAQSVLKTAWEKSGHELRGALAAYNTGKTTTPTGSQYSAQVFAKAGIKVPAISGGAMAKWATQNSAWTSSTLPPVHPKITWTPAASPLQPSGDGMTPSGINRHLNF